MNNHNNEMIGDPNEILRKEKYFYKTLYATNHTNPDAKENYIFFKNPNLPKLTEDMKLSCEGNITNDECKDALKLF